MAPSRAPTTSWVAAVDEDGKVASAGLRRHVATAACGARDAFSTAEATGTHTGRLRLLKWITASQRSP